MNSQFQGLSKLINTFLTSVKMLTFSDWENLTESKRMEQISALLVISRYDKENIYRPIKMIPELFHTHRNSILKRFPNGEYIHFSSEENTYDTYAFLYHWSTGACMDCFNHSIVWDKDDASIIYYCRYCGAKKQMNNF